jgi:ankyrin repeat protein
MPCPFPPPSHNPPLCPSPSGLVRLLLTHSARPDAADYSAGATALMLAARNGSAAAAEALLAGGASVNVVTPAGTTVLMHAVANGSVPLVRMLLKVSIWGLELVGCEGGLVG